MIMEAKDVKITLRNAGKIDPESIDDYIKAGGYKALEKASILEDLFLSVKESSSVSFSEFPVYLDEYPGCGPLAGLHTSLCAAKK